MCKQRYIGEVKCMKDRAFGIAYCGAVSIPAWILGKYFPVIGGPVFGILFGMILTLIIKTKGKLDMGIKFTSKKVLQYVELGKRIFTDNTVDYKYFANNIVFDV